MLHAVIAFSWLNGILIEGPSISIVQSRLNYCNSVFYGMSESNVEKFQTIKNKLARVVCGGSRLRSSKEMLMTLHWLTVRSRIKYKLAVLTYKALNMGQPAYLRDELSLYEPVRALRSSGTFQQRLPPPCTNSGRRAFRYSAPEILNTLPYELRSTSCIETFRRSLKTHFSNSLDSHDTWIRKLEPLKSSCYSYEKWRFINVHIIIIIMIILNMQIVVNTVTIIIKPFNSTGMAILTICHYII